jgi:tetratricopeptide (TPR) repeat protein
MLAKLLILLSTWEELIRTGAGLRDGGRYQEAQILFEQAREATASFDANDPRRAATLNYLGTVRHLRGEYRDAVALFEQAIAAHDRRPARIHPDAADALGNLAASLRRLGRTKESRTYYERALAVQKQTVGSHHPRTAITIHGLAWLAADEGRYDEAQKGFEEALPPSRAQ